MHGFLKSPKAIAAPVARRKPQFSIHHDVEIVDDYAWLRAENWQDVMRDPSLLDAEIRAHLDAENAYTDAQLADTRGLQETLFAEMKGRIKEDDSSVPAPDGPFEYFTSYVRGGQYPRIMRRPRGKAADTVILDGNLEGEGKPYWSLGDTAHSLDHKLMAHELTHVVQQSSGAMSDTSGGMTVGAAGDAHEQESGDDVDEGGARVADHPSAGAHDAGGQERQ